MKKEKRCLADAIVYALKLNKPCTIAVHSDLLATLARRSARSLAIIFGGNETLLNFVVMPEEKKKNCSNGTFLK